MKDTAGWAFFAIVVALIAWQVLTGEILLRGLPSIRIKREEQPAGFWIAIAFESAVALAVLGIAAYPYFMSDKQ